LSKCPRRKNNNTFLTAKITAKRSRVAQEAYLHRWEILSVALPQTLSPSHLPSILCFHHNPSDVLAGKALNKGLRPIGAPLEKGVTGPLGSALGGTTRGALGPLMGEKDERMEVIGGNNRDSYESKPEKIAGKEQTGDNPLGLDQTGRWGFRDE
jgi:hypothetical protein